MGDRIKKTMDGNEAAAYVSYAFTEVATIYPITPSSPMAELVDRWSAQGRKNIFGQSVRLMEMQSEHGAAGAMHGALEAGALATSYTASQGLLLMIPAMYRLAGQLHPAVLHVSARTVGTHAFSIFGDHSDVMACRQTGFAMLASASGQEIMDMAAVAHLAAIEGRVPFLHFFDGFRSSHEIQKLELLSYDELASLVNKPALEAFRRRALNPERPMQRSTVQNPDVFFQNREASNIYYDRLPVTVEKYLGRINELSGRDYKLFNYYGDPQAEEVVVAMGSVCDTLRETVDYLNRRGGRAGLIQVRLYRPFSVRHFLKALPPSVRQLTVLDRTKEPGAAGEPLYKDVCAALADSPKRPRILAGRFGLSSKDVRPEDLAAVYDNMSAAYPRSGFTIGINDDVTNLSLQSLPPLLTEDPRTVSCKFYGLASDGTVGANKNSIKIIGDNSELYVQAYFEYDTKKSGGLTRSHLRFGPEPIRSAYLIKRADFVACHNAAYLKKYDLVGELKEGGSLLINCPWSEQELDRELPDAVKRAIYDKGLKLYLIDAESIARDLGLGGRINSITQAAFFKVTGLLPLTCAERLMKEAIEKSYGHKGEKVLAMNYAAIDRGLAELRQIDVPSAWGLAEPRKAAPLEEADELPPYVRDIQMPINDLKGDELPVSLFVPLADGSVPLGSSRYEKRGIAAEVPRWRPEKCLGCNLCALVCPHAAIRPFLLTEDEAKAAPEAYETIKPKGKALSSLKLRVQVSPLDCNGCGSCVEVCPAKDTALEMRPSAEERAQADQWKFSLSLSCKPNPLDKFSVQGSQFEQPLLEFSGACAGCGETPYMKLLTQLFGDRMYVANATGCTQAWGAACPCVPYTVNHNGHGPAWSNSLFENNAEFSLGMLLAVEQQRQRLRQKVLDLAAKNAGADLALANVLQAWLEKFDSSANRPESEELLTAVAQSSLAQSEEGRFISDNREHLTKKSMWMYGGDGWAYDIGYGGLDHVLASGADVNVLVVDTELYSNTGGQSSKATPLGSVVQFAASGKGTPKKDLGLIAISYGHIYVAQVALGANPGQLIKALQEAESYPGPALIIAYAPCINHGLVKGMAQAQAETRLAVDCGYWHLYRFDPRRKAAGEKPFILDSKEPQRPLADFLNGEIRYAALKRSFPQRAEELLGRAEILAKEKYAQYLALSQQG